MKHRLSVTAGLLVALLAVAACGASKSTTAPGTSSSTSPTGSGSTAVSKTFTVGLLSDQTGLEAGPNKATVLGAKAAATLLTKQGITLKFINADSATNPATALSAAQSLVARDHVDIVIMNTAVGFAAAPYLAQQGIPVIGYPADGPEWLKLKNMFSVVGPLDSTKVSSLIGQYFKMQGGTVEGALGFSIAPQSIEQVKATALSVEAAGLKSGYSNTNFTFGSTNTQPVALGMKAAGVDAVASYTDQATGLSLLTSLRQAGVTLKVSALAVGYGADTLNAGAATIQAAQGATFLVGYEPVELQTAATKQFVAALKSAGSNGEPSFSAYNGYAAVLLLGQAVANLKTGASKAQIIAALTGITSFDAGGLDGSNPIDPGGRTNAPGSKMCSYYTKLSGQKFVPVAGASPLCGTILSSTVSGS